MIKLLVLMVSFAVVLNVESETPKKKGHKKYLVVYFSHSGNTREIATQIQKATSADAFEIKSVIPYPTDYDTVVEQARKELDAGIKPKIKEHIHNLGDYDVVFIGYPNWWSTYPAPVKTFLAEHDLGGKVIVPFCTHEGSGFGKSLKDLAVACPESKILEGLAIRGSSVKSANLKVLDWLKKIKVIE